MEVTKIEKANAKQKDYNKSYVVSVRPYCKKCLSPLLDCGTGDGFCDSECRREYHAENGKLDKEVYMGMRYGE